MVFYKKVRLEVYNAKKYDSKLKSLKLFFQQIF